MTVWKKKTFLFPSSVKFPQGLLPLKFKCQRHILIEYFHLTISCSFLNLYAEQAQLFNEETEEELREILSYEIYIQAVFITEKKGKFYGPTYEMPTEIKLTADLIKQINTYYESNKPTGIVTNPLFLTGSIFDLKKSQIKRLTSTIKVTKLLRQRL